MVKQHVSGLQNQPSQWKSKTRTVVIPLTAIIIQSLCNSNPSFQMNVV